MYTPTASVFDLTHCGNLEKVTLKSLHFEAVGYAWMRRILESNVSRKFREVLLAFDRPGYSSNIESNLQAIKDAFRSDLCPQLDELFSQKVYENLRLVDFVFLAYRGQAIPDATRWSTLIRDEMPKLDKRGIIQWVPSMNAPSHAHARHSAGHVWMLSWVSSTNTFELVLALHSHSGHECALITWLPSLIAKLAPGSLQHPALCIIPALTRPCLFSGPSSKPFRVFSLLYTHATVHSAAKHFA